MSEREVQMRSVIRYLVSIAAVAFIGIGMYFSWSYAPQQIELRHPGAPAKIIANRATATAFFEKHVDGFELVILFSETDDDRNVFKTRVRMVDGQTHSIVVGQGEGGDSDPGERFTFVRNGDVIKMTQGDPRVLGATFRL